MRPTALVIEDDDSYRLLLRVQLQRLGFSVIQAVDGWTGVKLASLHTPAVIVTDFMIPRMSGYEVWKSVQKDVQLRHIPLMVVSAHIDGRWGNHLHKDLYALQAETLREGVAMSLFEKGQPSEAFTAALRNLLGVLPIDTETPNESSLGGTALSGTVLIKVPEYNNATTIHTRF